MRGSGRVLEPTAARRVFLLLTVTRWFPIGLVIGVTTLWPLERGLSIEQALSASSLAGITIFLLELPTSGFADGFGRRPVYLTAAVVCVISGLVFFTATQWWQFALAAVLTGVYRALDSGPLEAWFVDTVHASESDAPVDRALSAQSAVLGASIALGAVISGGLIWWHPLTSESALLLPGMLYMGLSAVHAVVILLLLQEPRELGGTGSDQTAETAVIGKARLDRDEHVAAKVAAVSDTSAARPRAWEQALRSVRQAPQVVVSGLRLLTTSQVLAGLVAVELCWSAGMIVFETLQPIRLAELLGSESRAAAVMGPVASAGWGVFALGAALAGALSARIGVARSAVLARTLNGLGCVVMGLAAGPAALIGAYAFTYTMHGASGPLHSTLLHREASAANRATVHSINSMGGSIAFSLSAIGAGLLTTHLSTAAVMVLVGALSTAGAVFYLPALRRDRDDRHRLAPGGGTHIQGGG